MNISWIFQGLPLPFIDRSGNLVVNLHLDMTRTAVSLERVPPPIIPFLEAQVLIFRPFDILLVESIYSGKLTMRGTYQFHRRFVEKLEWLDEQTVGSDPSLFVHRSIYPLPVTS